MTPLLAVEPGAEAGRLTGTLIEHIHEQVVQLGEPEANSNEREG